MTGKLPDGLLRRRRELSQCYAEFRQRPYPDAIQKSKQDLIENADLGSA